MLLSAIDRSANMARNGGRNTIMHFYFQRDYRSETYIYAALFALFSLFYLLHGDAKLVTNDDWALRGMLAAKGVYGTLIMSYPLSFVMSKLYDIFPAVPFYSLLLTVVMALNLYFWARYIAQTQSMLQKIVLLGLSLVWLTFLWLNLSITILTVTTIVTAVGVIRINKSYSFMMLIVAALLRLDIMILMVPYYIVSYLILSEKIGLHKREWRLLVALILVLAASILLQKQDRAYQDWILFNKARASIVDMGVMHGSKEIFTKEELFCIQAGWWQDPVLLPSEKLIGVTPSFFEMLSKRLQSVDIAGLIKNYIFKHWLWLLLSGSLVAIVLGYQQKRVFFLLFFVAGVFVLLLTRDVVRVTAPVFVWWALLIFEILRGHRIISTLFLALFTAIFVYYASGQWTHKYVEIDMALQKEAKELIQSSGKVCEPSITFPTGFIGELTAVFNHNYLFREERWMHLGDKEILPSGWLSRHPFFYETHDMSDRYRQRKYQTYHDYLVDEKSAFFGSNYLVPDESFKRYLLEAYDKRYLKERPECRHKSAIVKRSEHFSISQIYIECDPTKHKK